MQVAINLTDREALESAFKAAKATYDKAALAERRHEGSRAETDYYEKKMYASLTAWRSAVELSEAK